MIWVPNIPPLRGGERQGGMARALDPKILWALPEDIPGARDLPLAVVAQFLFLFGTYPAQRFLIYLPARSLR